MQAHSALCTRPSQRSTGLSARVCISTGSASRSAVRVWGTGAARVSGAAVAVPAGVLPVLPVLPDAVPPAAPERLLSVPGIAAGRDAAAAVAGAVFAAAGSAAGGRRVIEVARLGGPDGAATAGAGAGEGSAALFCAAVLPAGAGLVAALLAGLVIGVPGKLAVLPLLRAGAAAAVLPGGKVAAAPVAAAEARPGALADAV